MVWLALDQLKKKNLIENEIATPSAFEGMNRRDVIKKVGFASMIALPVSFSTHCADRCPCAFFALSS
ncbi:MAG: hypothetical protein ACR2N3_06390 [Pyrinomonadaceae bacterium]